MITIRSIIPTEAASPTEPVTLTEIKRWLNVDHTDDDALLTDMGIGARQDIENETNLKLVPNTVEMFVYTSKEDDLIRLPYGTPDNVTIDSVDTSGNEDAVDVDDYYFKGNSVMIGAGEYKISYDVGNTVDQALKEAILMLAAYRYNNRGDQEKQQGLPDDVQRKIAKYVEPWY